MRENNKNLQRETEAAFALTTILVNLLILLVLGSGVWLVQMVLTQKETLNTLFRDFPML